LANLFQSLDNRLPVRPANVVGCVDMLASQACAFVAGICGVGALVMLSSAPTLAVETTTLRATYAISIAGIMVGRAEAEGRFSGDGYAAAIVGSTRGVSRLVSVASAHLSGNGHILGGAVLPATYDMSTIENGFATHVTMAMHQGTVTSVLALPELAEAADRIPVTAANKTDVVDPLSAFLVPLDRPGVPRGHRACDRTVKVFDGWTRYDVQLTYKETKAIDGSAETYSGLIIVCGARYIPVAGHRPTRKAVQEMANNKRLEVWLAPVAGVAVLVPFRIMIGTGMGDLIIHATRFTTNPPERHATAE
jgi:hypothetical protein